MQDRWGGTWPRTEAPTWPVLVLLANAPLSGTPEPVVLLRGAGDSALLEDLERSPLRADTREREVAIQIARDLAWTIVPAERLERGTEYTVAVGAWAEDPHGRSPEAPFVATFRTGTSARTGAHVTGSWPADGTGGIGTNTAWLAVRFEGVPMGALEGVHLETDTGRVAATVEPAACADMGWPGGTCVALRPVRHLAPSALHRLMVAPSVTDASGAPVGPWTARFHTAPEPDRSPPTWIPETCGVDELTLDAGCALPSDSDITLRVHASEPVLFLLRWRGPTKRAIAPRGSAAIALAGLVPDETTAARLFAIDAAGNESAFEMGLTTTPPLAAVSITEVRADPRGPEPRQEYIEVLNSGDSPIDLAGFAISDRADSLGDIIERSTILPPHARALLVADGFDPAHELDDPVPPGTMLVHVGTSLASGGLSNAGESVYLRDTEARRLSAAPSDPTPRAGVCLVRVSTDGRTGATEAFAYDAEAGCTPGMPDRLP